MSGVSSPRPPQQQEDEIDAVIRSLTETLDQGPQRRHVNPPPPAAYAPEPESGGGPPPSPPSNPDRKFAAKRINEHVKAIWGAANGMALALIAAALVTSYVGKDAPQEMDADRIQWAVIGVLFHVLGHVVIALFMQKED